MRLATWNMDYWRRSDELSARAWDFLRERVRPDVEVFDEEAAWEPSGHCPIAVEWAGA